LVYALCQLVVGSRASVKCFDGLHSNVVFPKQPPINCLFGVLDIKNTVFDNLHDYLKSVYKDHERQLGRKYTDIFVCDELKETTYKILEQVIKDGVKNPKGFAVN
jgi:hypothetical protein